MPIQQIAENAAHIAENTTLLSVIKDWASIIFPVAGTIGAVFTWAWGRMQKGVDRIEDALTTHAERNEELFDLVFTEQRVMAEKLNTLYGKCEATHDKSRPDFREWSVNNEFTGQHIQEGEQNG